MFALQKTRQLDFYSESTIKSLLLLFNATCLMEKQQIPFLFFGLSCIRPVEKRETIISQQSIRTDKGTCDTTNFTGNTEPCEIGYTNIFSRSLNRVTLKKTKMKKNCNDVILVRMRPSNITKQNTNKMKKTTTKKKNKNKNTENKMVGQILFSFWFFFCNLDAFETV